MELLSTTERDASSSHQCYITVLRRLLSEVHISTAFSFRLFKYSSLYSGVITTLAGTGKPGNKDSKEGMKAQFHCPAGITVDQKTGNIYVCDQNNHCIRRISPQGIDFPLSLYLILLKGAVATLAGSGQPGFRDGDSSAAQFNFPTGILFLENLQCLIVCDTANNKLRKITLSGKYDHIEMISSK